MNLYLWLKALHLLVVIAWFAGLFYLPRLFVYHSETTDAIGYERFCTMERRLFYGIMTPNALLTLIVGIGVYHAGGAAYYHQQSWFWLKVFFVALLIVYHLYCGMILYRFKKHQNTRTATFYRWFNEFPLFPLIAILILVVVKPVMS